MGNGTAGLSGRASASLNPAMAERALTISGIFPGETVMFPIGDLDAGARRQLAGCFGR